LKRATCPTRACAIPTTTCCGTCSTMSAAPFTCTPSEHCPGRRQYWSGGTGTCRLAINQFQQWDAVEEWRWTVFLASHEVPIVEVATAHFCSGAEPARSDLANGFLGLPSRLLMRRMPATTSSLVVLKVPEGSRINYQIDGLTRPRGIGLRTKWRHSCSQRHADRGGESAGRSSTSSLPTSSAQTTRTPLASHEGRGTHRGATRASGAATSSGWLFTSRPRRSHVSTTVSGLSDIESIPSASNHSARSG
jgi:hypothetical protein